MNHQPNALQEQRPIDLNTFPQRMQTSIKIAARRRTLEKQQEYIISNLQDAHDAATVFESRGQGISEIQLADIQAERSNTRAAQKLFKALTSIESGLEMLVDYFNDRKPECGVYLNEECDEEETDLIKQISDFVANREVKEKNRTRRQELIRILKQQYKVKEDGQSVIKI